jgi:hypothetical protein
LKGGDQQSLPLLNDNEDLVGALSVQAYQSQILYKNGQLHEGADALFWYPINKKQRTTRTIYFWYFQWPGKQSGEEQGSE